MKEKAKLCSSSQPVSPIAANGVTWQSSLGAIWPVSEKQLILLLT